MNYLDNLLPCTYLCAFWAALCFVVAEITGNCSQVDKLWSIVPWLYCWVFAYLGDFTPRLVLMASLTTIWGFRLTYNFARKGGFTWPPWTGEEDYRWEVLRHTWPLNNRFVFALFDLFFIAIYQHFLLMLIALPAGFCLILQIKGASQGVDVGELTQIDLLVAFFAIGDLCFETVADQQQWNFQTEKYRRKNAGEPLTDDYQLGFCRTGLWSISRHPNFFAEQLFWVIFYFFSVAATFQAQSLGVSNIATFRWNLDTLSDFWYTPLINWSVIGFVLLILLFQGSTSFTEQITGKKYPAYAQYQREVPRLIPCPCLVKKEKSKSG